MRACRMCRRTKAHDDSIANRLVQRRLVAEEVLGTADAPRESSAVPEQYVCNVQRGNACSGNPEPLLAPQQACMCTVKRQKRLRLCHSRRHGLLMGCKGKRGLRLLCSLRPPPDAPVVLVEAK